MKFNIVTVFLADIKMDKKFCIFCNTLQVSDVCPNCQKINVVRQWMRLLQYIFHKVFGRTQQDKNVNTYFKNKIKAAKHGRRNLMNETTAQKLNKCTFCRNCVGRVATGYRSIWWRLPLYHGLFVPRDVVILALKQPDPDG